MDRRGQTGLQHWMRAYLTWLVESPHGKDEAKNGNNHETWYDVQVAALAMYTGQSDARAANARAAHASRIARQIRAGRPSAARAGAHAVVGLQHLQPAAFFDLATLERTRQPRPVELPHARTARSLRKAFDYLVPFASGERKWTHAQITPFRATRAATRCCAAPPPRGRNRSTASWRRVGGGSPRLALTCGTRSAGL